MSLMLAYTTAWALASHSKSDTGFLCDGHDDVETHPVCMFSVLSQFVIPRHAKC